MAQNKELIRRLKRRGMSVTFIEGINRGIHIPKDKDFVANEKFLAVNIGQIKTITQQEWDKVVLKPKLHAVQ